MKTISPAQTYLPHIEAHLLSFHATSTNTAWFNVNPDCGAERMSAQQEDRHGKSGILSLKYRDILTNIRYRTANAARRNASRAWQDEAAAKRSPTPIESIAVRQLRFLAKLSDLLPSRSAQPGIICRDAGVSTIQAYLEREIA